MGCVQSQPSNDGSVATLSYHQRFRKVNNDVSENEAALNVAMKYAKDTSSNSMENLNKKPVNTSRNIWVNSTREGPPKDLHKMIHSRFPLWKKYEKCTFCVKEDRRRSSCDDDFIKITHQRPGKEPLCKRCSKDSMTLKPNNNRQSHGIESLNVASFANLLALTALDLTAPASDAILKNRKNSWIQVAGHPGSFAPAGPNTVWKKRIAKENHETKAYEALMDDPITEPIIPFFSREVEYNGEFFIEMEDLLHHFSNPNIMDVKMGKRTFLESEVKNPVLRKDLYEKMVKLDPDAPTPAEREQEAITKLRYMQFRERESSTADLGFRIDAVRMAGEDTNTNLKKVKTTDQVKATVTKFTHFCPMVIKPLCARLKDIRDRFERSNFFRTHEVIGGSLLFLYDKQGHAGVWVIDFAKTIPVEAKMVLNHRSPWQLGNHEDGFLSGLDNLIQIFDEMEASQGSEIVLHSRDT
ncbi:inositol-trisphosphate 3-kinase homolog [Haliotis cracherodii]|uniref:inositol-trisphosphate 3-kinase homolog n=1 Tax=Haliotis cracherodii TaxID=6455 RepID=UPI0039EC174D